MIVKTFLIFAILSFVGNSKGDTIGLIDFTADDNFNVTKIFENYNFACFIAFNTIIDRNLYNPDNLEPTDEAYKVIVKEYIKTYFNLLRVNYKPHDEMSSVYDWSQSSMWIEYYHISGWIENHENEVRGFAYYILQLNHGNDPTLTDVDVVSVYDHCQTTMSLLSNPSILVRERLSNMFINYKTADKLPVSMEYGFILLLIKNGEIEDFFSSSSHDQLIFIVDLMNQAIINTYETIIKIYNGLKSINDEMFNILRDIHQNIINATEAVYGVQESHRQKRIKKDSSSNAVKQPEYQSELIDMYRIYIKNLEAKLKKERLGADQNDLSKYQGRLVEYKENKHTIRVPVMGYYMISQAEKFKILNKNIGENEYYELLMELRIWIIMIQNFANNMKVEEFDTNYNIDHPHFKYLTEMKKFFEGEREKIRQYELLYIQGKPM